MENLLATQKKQPNKIDSKEEVSEKRLTAFV